VRATPLIALTTSELRRPDDVRHEAQAEPPRVEMALGLIYPEAIEAAGGIPVVLPPLRPEAIGPMLDRVDAVCLSGGPDIQPAAYGAEPHPALGPTEPKVDAFELALIRAADQRGLPVLAICRGMQMLNVARGGTLHQHLPDVAGDAIAHRQQRHASVPTHRIKVAHRCLVRRLLGDAGREVNSFHHQAIDALGRDLVATAWAPDGTIEAVEQPGGRFVLGVQWHAEGLPAHLPLFAALVDAAAGQRAGLAEAG
jgi:putative glutamine amidotransferase